MINIDKLSYSIGDNILYNKVSFTLEEGQKCAFIGTSGTGKSTLLNILMDPKEYLFDGKVEMDPQTKIGYVTQFIEQEQSKALTVFEYIAEHFIELEKEIENICKKMETASEIEPLLEQYQNTLDAFEAIGGGDYENQIEKKLGLADLDKIKDLKIAAISGGEFKLIQVIKEMMNNPDLLIMDEPDVFLDFENLNSLKNLINSHKRTILVITHNRYLLNHCFNKIIHLENMELQEFNGKYIDYNFSLLQKKIELQELSAKDDEEIARNEALIDNLREIATYNKEASRGRALKARVRFQERLIARRIKAPFVEIKKPSIYFEAHNPIEDETAIKISDFSAAFDEILLENVSLDIGSKDKVALIGPNGTGKTTLFRAIAKGHPNIEVHEDIEVAYLSQAQGEGLNEENTIMREFIDAGVNNTTEIRRHLRGYGFTDDHMNQKISSLSGGEKNILQLAKVAKLKSNLMLLDEPTSHLDTYSQIALEEAIQNYDGAVIMISHDYYSIINCMDYVLMIEDKGIRRVRMRTFRKMIYKDHFNKDYLLLEQKKKEVETKVEHALAQSDYEKAEILCDELEAVIKQM